MVSALAAIKISAGECNRTKKQWVEGKGKAADVKRKCEGKEA